MEKHQEEEATDIAGRKSYPPAEAEYQQLVENADLFFHKLRNFNSSLDTNFTSPSVGGTSLDLHRLFVEVTSRGGIDKVIRDRKWEEVISAFKFPTTSMCVSFILRKYYVSLLYQFEQAYFLRKRVSTVAIADEIPVNASTVESNKNVTEESTATCHLPASPSLSPSPQIQPGISLVGIIDEKFDNGYVVSVNVGSDQLKGILYHIPDRPQPSWSPNHDHSIPQCRKRRKSHLTLLDPSEPKPTGNSCNFFAEHYSTLKPTSQVQEKSISKNIGHLWDQLSETEKQFYQDKGVTD